MELIPTWAIWIGGAFLIGVGLGWLLKGPKPWLPGDKGEKYWREI